MQLAVPAVRAVVEGTAVVTALKAAACYLAVSSLAALRVSVAAAHAAVSHRSSSPQ